MTGHLSSASEVKGERSQVLDYFRNRIDVALYLIERAPAEY
jgi:hypothetical protein